MRVEIDLSSVRPDVSVASIEDDDTQPPIWTCTIWMAEGESATFLTDSLDDLNTLGRAILAAVAEARR